MKIKLITKPLTLNVNNIDSFIIGLEIHNSKDNAINPNLQELELLINGEPSIAWHLTLSNGKKDGKWYKLPAYETISIEWSNLGKSLFTKDGTYELQLKRGSNIIDSVQIKIINELK